MSVGRGRLVGGKVVLAEDPGGLDVEATCDEVDAVGVDGGVSVLDPADGLPVEVDGLGELFLRQVAPHAQLADAVPNPVAVVLEPGVDVGHIATLRRP